MHVIYFHQLALERMMLMLLFTVQPNIKHQHHIKTTHIQYTLLICLGYSVFDSQEPSFMFCFHREFDAKIDNDDAWELFPTYEWFGVLLFHMFIHTQHLFFLAESSLYFELFNFECVTHQTFRYFVQAI